MRKLYCLAAACPGSEQAGLDYPWMDTNLFSDHLSTTASKTSSLQSVTDPGFPNCFIQSVGVSSSDTAPPANHSKVKIEFKFESIYKTFY